METKLKLGVITSLLKQQDIEEKIKKVNQLSLPSCQASTAGDDLYTKENAKLLVDASKEYDVEITTIWAGFSGVGVWNFIEGPSTIGLGPESTRDERVQTLIKAAEFADMVGTTSVTTHVGFLPENPKDELYEKMVDAIAIAAKKCDEYGIDFCFETGQETPITLLRAIKDVGTKNLGINLDPANLLMYGKANPVDALDILGPYVKGMHAKDGDYPTQPMELGKELPLGEGRVNFPVLIAKLKTFGYNGALTIEREISGDQQLIDIKKAIELLEPLC